jgi:hypothetical protein
VEKTVILDCCHSGSGTRKDDIQERGIEFKSGETRLTVPEDYGQGFRNAFLQSPDRGIFLDGTFLNHSLRSHILLAACGSKQRACEGPGGGVFTSILLRILQAEANSRAIYNLTYVELIKRIGAVVEK